MKAKTINRFKDLKKQKPEEKNEMSRRDLSARIEDEVSDFKIHDLNNWVGTSVIGRNKTRPASVESRSNNSNKSGDSSQNLNNN